MTDPHPSIDANKAGHGMLKRTLRAVRFLLPGERLQTSMYFALIGRPRRLLKRALTAFYRMEHVYDVLREFTGRFEGPFSILEFGTAQGYAFAKLAYAVRHLKLEDQVTVHGLDSFEGLPPSTDADRGFTGNDWIEGSYRASYDVLQEHCRQRGYANTRLHKGYFEETLTPTLLDELRRTPPILVWIDCDLYESSVTVFERLIPVLPTGCVIYFDDLEFNFSSRFTGQARLVHEVNTGRFGDDIELVVDPELSWDSRRIYRFIRTGEHAVHYRSRYRRATPPQARAISDGSPFP